MKFSAQILCGDCAHTITKCLSSVEADEIVCTVDTRYPNYQEVFQLCELHPKSVVNSFDWPNDSFSEARNFALNHCTGDYIICIDADEECIKLDIPNEPFDFLMCKVWKDGRMFYYPRIFKAGLRFNYARHNEIDLTGLNGIYTETEFRGLSISTPEEALMKTQALLQRHFQQLEEEKDNPTLHFRISQCYLALKDYKQCIEFGHLALMDKINIESKAQICLSLYMSYRMLKRDYTARNYLELSIGLLPEQRQGRMFMYEDLIAAKCYDEASKLKEEITKINFSRLPSDLSEDQCAELFNQIT